MTDKLLLKALLLSVLLIETFDELEEQDSYKHFVKKFLIIVKSLY